MDPTQGTLNLDAAPAKTRRKAKRHPEANNATAETVAEVCELPPEESDEPEPLPTPKERIAARVTRFAELWKEQLGNMHRDWSRPKRLERFALLQRSPDGKVWLSTHETPDDAASFCSDDDSGFTVVRLYDLEHTATSYEPVRAFHFRMVR